MSVTTDHTDDNDRNDDSNDRPAHHHRPARPPRPRWFVKLAVAAGVGLLIVAVVLWKSFFHFVPPGKMLVVIAKNGAPLPAGQVLAEPGQKGVQRPVL